MGENETLGDLEDRLDVGRHQFRTPDRHGDIVRNAKLLTMVNVTGEDLELAIRKPRGDLQQHFACRPAYG